MSFAEQIALRQHSELEGVASGGGAAEQARPNYEASFVQRLQAGEAAAFDRLVAERTNDIYALLLRLTEDAEEARDLAQETFLQAFRSISSFRGDADLKTWLYRIAVNHARNRRRWWRRRRRDATISIDEPHGADGDRQSLQIADATNANPEQLTLQRERERKLRTALLALSRDHREVVVLRDIEGMSYEEVAATLETSVGTIKSRLSRARAELRRRLDDSI